MTDVNLTVVPLKLVGMKMVAIAGPPGPQGDGSVITEFEFDIASSGDQTIMMPSQIGNWTALYVNGLRQDKSAYSFVGSTLQLPGSLIWVGAHCLFEYFPVITG